MCQSSNNVWLTDCHLQMSSVSLSISQVSVYQLVYHLIVSQTYVSQSSASQSHSVKCQAVKCQSISQEQGVKAQIHQFFKKKSQTTVSPSRVSQSDNCKSISHSRVDQSVSQSISQLVNHECWTISLVAVRQSVKCQSFNTVESTGHVPVSYPVKNQLVQCHSVYRSSFSQSVKRHLVTQ